MHSQDVVDDVLARLAGGLTASQVARDTGLSRSTVRDWARGRAPSPPDRRCFVCSATPPVDAAAYAHLLGLYLGDGCVSRHQGRQVHSLRIACADAYPRLIEECETSVRAVRPGPTVRVPSQGCTYVQAWWKHWPCVFPQHGPGRKHERAIVLEAWQRELVEQHPGPFLRGLFHSDGCRVVNWATRTVDGVTTRYDGYPRYFFTNRSEDVLGLCTWALDLVGIAWTRPSTTNVSVARRAAVALLDEHVGPKS